MIRARVTEQFQMYDAESRRILEEARAEYRRKKARGYSREQAFQDFENVQQEIAAQLAAHRT